ncbi:exonuclease domain-containing protein [Cupriavidus neocaledonicus]|uniref:Membrane linked exonuclease n=1 Tax=Cupriavidus neocaledonicus TaxID=1040979 RepID=A0A375HAK1_9BURK|nr:exonuclease domain-containing protein [Cupriavidus neocaledonicus]SOZ35320.1 putative membrane linked exonuclease [Cupriavidus neocaledonicus]SPD47267.1 putative membrane linked exonuclease [Cupriavidus neocaledonicus]
MRVAIVSTETTGLTPADEPVSIGLLLVEVSPRAGGLVREVAEYYGSQEPTVPISAAATETHGLTADMLRGRRFYLGAMRAIVDEAEVLVAHGAAFNARMLEKVLPGIHHKRWRCSVRQVRWSQYFYAANHKLDTLCEHLHIFRPRPQVALDDCLALSRLLFRPIDATRQTTPMGFLLAEADFMSLLAPTGCGPAAPPAAPPPAAATGGLRSKPASTAPGGDWPWPP